MSGCRTDSVNYYTCSAITYPNGTSVNLNLTTKLQLRATSVVDSNGRTVGEVALRFPDTVSLSNVQFVNEYVGSRTLKLTCNYDVTTTLPNMIVQPYVRYNIEPNTIQDINSMVFFDSE